MQSFLHQFEASIVNAPDYYDFSLSFAGFTFSHICFKADDRLCFEFLYVFFYLYFFSQMKMTQLAHHQQVRTMIFFFMRMYVWIFLLTINEQSSTIWTEFITYSLQNNISEVSEINLVHVQKYKTFIPDKFISSPVLNFC